MRYDWDKMIYQISTGWINHCENCCMWCILKHKDMNVSPFFLYFSTLSNFIFFGIHMCWKWIIIFFDYYLYILLQMLDTIWLAENEIKRTILWLSNIIEFNDSWVYPSLRNMIWTNLCWTITKHLWWIFQPLICDFSYFTKDYI